MDLPRAAPAAARAKRVHTITAGAYGAMEY